MRRRVFFSFHYQNDAWRASQVRNAGVVGNMPLSDNDWETVKRGGNAAIEKWIDNQLCGCSCTVVLVGAKTANRPWIKHEIIKSWRAGKGLVGVRIHHLKDRNGKTSQAGRNPFDDIRIDGTVLSDFVRLHEPWAIPLLEDSTDIYRKISEGLAGWVENAIAARAKARKTQKGLVFI